MNYIFVIFVALILAISIAILLKYLPKEAFGGHSINKPAEIISISGKLIYKKSDGTEIPLPKEIILRYPNTELATLNYLYGKMGSGSFGLVAEYKGTNGRLYMVKSQPEKYWKSELDWWRQLPINIKGLFVESYFGSPGKWMVSNDDAGLAIGPNSPSVVSDWDINRPDYYSQGLPTPNAPIKFISPTSDMSSYDYVTMSSSGGNIQPLNSYGIIIMEAFDGSLDKLADSHPDPGVVNSVMRQLLTSMDTLLSSNFIYTDLKAPNIVYKIDHIHKITVIKLIDIGSLCKLDKCQLKKVPGPTEPLITPFPCTYTYGFEEDTISNCTDYITRVTALILFQLITTYKNTLQIVPNNLNSPDKESYIRPDCMIFAPILNDMIQNNYTSLSQLKERFIYG